MQHANGGRMPSWNIHTAHVERLLSDTDASALGIRDANAFLFGNLLPDIYVGYMVPNTTKIIDYRITHLTHDAHVPLAGYGVFGEKYVEGTEIPSDMVLGAWTHLACDAVYNEHTRRYLAEAGIKPNDKIRALKQADFARFGRTLKISSVPQVTEALLAEAVAFPQYSVEPKDVQATVAVARDIVEENQREHIVHIPDYELLSADFFEAAFSSAHTTMKRLLMDRLKGEGAHD